MSQHNQPAEAGQAVPDITIKIRLAVRQDLPRLIEIAREAVKPGDGTLQGQKLKFNPEQYLDEARRRLDLYAMNDGLTCIVAETEDSSEAGGRKTILGYCGLLWVQHLVKNDGSKVTWLGLLPRAVQIREKHLSGWRPEQHRQAQISKAPPESLWGKNSIFSHDANFTAYWGLDHLVTDPALDKHHTVRDVLLGRICRLADEEQIMLGALAWPVSDLGAVVRHGFEVRRTYHMSVEDGDGKAVGVMEVAQLRRLPVQVSSPTKSLGMVTVEESGDGRQVSPVEESMDWQLPA